MVNSEPTLGNQLINPVLCAKESLQIYFPLESGSTTTPDLELSLGDDIAINSIRRSDVISRIRQIIIFGAGGDISDPVISDVSGGHDSTAHLCNDCTTYMIFTNFVEYYSKLHSMQQISVKTVTLFKLSTIKTT